MQLELKIISLCLNIEKLKKSISDATKNIDNYPENERAKILTGIIVDIADVSAKIIEINIIVDAVMKNLFPAQPVCIASTREEKVNWFLDNKIYEKRSPFDPDFDFIMKQEVAIYAFSKT